MFNVLTTNYIHSKPRYEATIILFNKVWETKLLSTNSQTKNDVQVTFA
jgi:hypothetical protein